MKIKFKQIDDQEVKIIGIEGGLEKEIGCIFTPSSSGQNITNAIQICGFKEAFDLWGCGRYVIIKGDKTLNLLKNIEDKNIEWESAKDIQLFFSSNTKARNQLKETRLKLGEECSKCYNKSCTCENTTYTPIKKGKNKLWLAGNPFKVKREHDLKELEHEKKT